MKNLKKLLALVLALLMVVSMVACGAKKEEAKEIVINFPCIWVGTDAKAPYMAKLVEEFNAANAGSIKVVIEEQTDYQAYRDKIRTLITTGNAPDIFSVDNPQELANFSATGKLMDFTSALEGDWKATFNDGCIDPYIYENGQINFLPFESAVIPLVYNTELLAEVGYETFPATYAEMMEMFAALKEAGYNACGQMAAENAWTSMLWYSQLVASIGGPEVYKNGLEDPAFVQAAEVLREMYNYTFDGAISAAAADVNGHFIARDTAVYINGCWWIGNFYKEENAVDGKLLADVVDVTGAPTWEGGKGEGAVVTQAQAFLCAAKQDDPAKEAAIVKFLQYITEPTRIAEWEASAGSMFFIEHDPAADLKEISKKFAAVSNEANFTIYTFAQSVPLAVTNEFPAAVSALANDVVDAQGFVDMLIAARDNA